MPEWQCYFQAEARIMNGTDPVTSVWSNVVGPPATAPVKGGIGNQRPVNPAP